MRVYWSSYTRFLYSLFLVLTIAGTGSFHAVAQETDAPRPLDRVEVLPPDRRPTPVPARTTGSGVGADSEPSPPSEGRSPEGGASGVEGTSTVGATTLSLVEGKSTVSTGAASLPSQVSELTSQDIQRLNVQNYTDLFKTIPGMKVFSYGQGEIGHPFTLRGYAGGHGTDTAVFIDGVPQNFPSAAQGGTGMSDFSWLNPDTIEKIEIIKGPTSALYGDFALAGVVNIVTKKSQPNSSLNSYGGSFGAFRAFGVFSSETWVPTPYIAHEYYSIDGYRDNSQWKKWSPFNKVSFPLWAGILSLRYNYYTSDFGSAGYLRIDEVRQRIRSRKGAINTTDGGDQKRYEVVMNYGPACGQRGLYAALYVDGYHKIRYSTFPPSNQSAQGDDRTYWGGRVYYNLVFGEDASLIVGGETRQDSGSAYAYNTNSRQWIPSGTTTSYEQRLGLSNWAWFLQGQIKLAESLKIVGGLRSDYFTIDVENKTRPENSGIGYPGIMVPKIGFVITPTKNVNIFGNIVQGLRSPAARDMSPFTAGATKNFTLEPSRLDSSDVGVNIILFSNLYLAADYYHTIQAQEIRTVNNQPLNVGQTVRKGYELEAKFYPTNEIAVFANYAWVDARVPSPVNAGQFLVTGISEHTIKGGIDITKDFGEGRRLLIDAYYQYVSGPPNYYSTQAVPIVGPDYDVYNLKLTYEGRGWSSFVSAKYQPREFASEYSGLTKQYLSFDPQPKWDFTSGLTYNFW